MKPSDLNIRLIAPYAVDGIQNGTIEELEKFLEENHRYVVDTETRAKEFYRREEAAALDCFKNEVIMLQIGDTKVQFVVDTRYLNIMQTKIPFYLADKHKIKILMNAKFDYKTLATNYQFRMENVRDIMIREMVLNMGREMPKGFYSLKGLSERYLGYKYRESDQLDLFSTEDLTESLSKETRLVITRKLDEPFTKNEIVYGAMDVYSPVLIHDKQLKILELYELEKHALFREDGLLCIGDLEIQGMPISRNKWEKLAEDNILKLEEARLKLIDLVATDPLLKKFVSNQGDLFSFDAQVFIKWSSTQQVATICEALNLDIKVLNKEMSKKVDREVFKNSLEERVLGKYRKSVPFVAAFLDYKLYQKAVTTYGLDFLKKNVHPCTGHVHSQYRLMVASGRLASSSPNLQNIPTRRMPEFRECFKSHMSHSFIVSDYSNQEVRILADYSGDSELIRVLNEGKDIHSEVAKKVFSVLRGYPVEVSKSVNSDLRDRGKTVNFLIAYGGSAHKLADDFGMSQEEAQDIIDTYFEQYPDLEEFFQKSRRNAMDSGYIVIDDVLKSKSFLDKWEVWKEAKGAIDKEKYEYGTATPAHYKAFRQLRGKMERKSVNYRIQGTGALMTLEALIRLRKYKIDNNCWDLFHVINVVHDEIVVLCKTVHATEVSNIVKQAMEDAGHMFCKKVKIIAEPAIENTWKH